MVATAVWAVVSLTVGFALFRPGESSYGGTG